MDAQIQQNITLPGLSILILLVPFICISRLACEKFAARTFVQLNIGQINKESKIWKRNLRIKKFQESIWKFTYYTSVTLFAMLTISWEKFIFKPFEAFEEVALGYNKLEHSVKAYYSIQIAFYLWMSISLIWDVRRKDFHQMAIHHFSTLILLLWSYTSGTVQIGCIVLLVHDLSDPVLEAAKLFNYAKIEIISSGFFVLFMFVFWISRLVMFPMMVLKPIFTQAAPILYRIHGNLRIYYGCNILLWVLMILNLMWSFTIFKALVRKVTAGGKIKDDRSDDEDE